ncbi:hypothetical protein OIDMADRAFT_36068 [Oidiodendron maius Zn]|uniref:Uncharacterized protein n=1 Tax=Oidiodendron maius (strain Zn) TaxID=913774 RepID=A0A0C3CTZ3_OIDMZ|nr:hypothetical protein OIDMADRAFT_36068 [Oidiodendron maius Zn]
MWKGSLAYRRPFSRLGVETAASVKLTDATTAFNKGEFTKSANLFLQSWRILQNEYESNLYKQYDRSFNINPLGKDYQIVRENKERTFLSLVALHDLAAACLSNYSEDYKDEDGKCKLDLNTLHAVWSRDTTAEALEIETTEALGIKDGSTIPLPIGSAVTRLGIQLRDPLGRLLEKAETFIEAGIIIMRILSFQFQFAFRPLKEVMDACKFFDDSISTNTWFPGIYLEGKRNVKNVSIAREAPNRDTTEEDDEIRKKLIVKMQELKNGPSPLSTQEEEKLLSLFNNMQVTPSLWQNTERERAGRDHRIGQLWSSNCEMRPQ